MHTRRAILAGAGLVVAAGMNAMAAAPTAPCVSGIYPHLATFNNEGECGTGAVVPWADRLWAISYGPHLPKGSSDKLYEITPDLRQIIRPESIGGTPANRMIHRESQQLFIGPYVIGADRGVRVIPYTTMYGRHTGMARHLTDPTNKIVCATMEEGVYEVDVRTLAVKELWADEQLKEGRHAGLPGYHGKGFYSAQGRYVYANNGDHASEARSNPTVPSGALAEWDGKADKWTVVRRNQFTDVTGPGGIEGNPPGDDRLWSIGWDHRSLILMLLDRGAWHAYRLPKASHCYDGAHGWNTEWPRIRDIGEDALLLTMHGCFWRFPKTFAAANSAGLAPRSTYLKVIGDFCRWQDRVVCGCDDTAKSEFLNTRKAKGKLAGPGQSQSNLWFVEPARLDALGPALGRGAVWWNDDVQAGAASDPFLFAGFARRSLHLAHGQAEPVTFRIEVDAAGNGSWRALRSVVVPARGYAWAAFAADETGAWVRVVADRDCAGVNAFFHYRQEDPRGATPAAIFDGLAAPGAARTQGGLLYARGANLRTLSCVRRDPAGEPRGYELTDALELRPLADRAAIEKTLTLVPIPTNVLQADAASVLYVDGKSRWRLPKGDPAFDLPGAMDDARICREVCTERDLFNAHGTFYELPAENAGGFAKIRPVATHNRRIKDYASYRGLLVISGVASNAPAHNPRIVRSADGACALWVGVVDDLWQLGKPRGTGGPWKDSTVTAGRASDPYLMTGYDRKRLTLSHAAAEPVTFTVEVDIAGTGQWLAYRAFTVPPGQPLAHAFDESFSAYWVRVVSDRACTATAQFVYE